jgi:hypothetical protein
MLGIPFTEKPSSFNGFFKYSPAYYSSGGVQTIDSCAIIALLSYWDGSQRVTIAEANYYTSDTIANYTPFSIPFVYSLPNTPDTISIIFSSSVNGNFFIGGIGSTLFIDNISFDYSSSIEKPSEKIALKKRYLDENLLLDFEEAFSGKIRLLNTNAQEIYVNETEEAHSFSIPLSALPKGIYILEINSFTGKRYTDKIIRL